MRRDSDNLLEDELFGHEEGAFTGASRRRRGKFEKANGGSIFLDEIGDLPLVLQPKILRVLQEREYERIGGNETHVADVRVIAATHRDLGEMVAEREFREDLFYRLNVIPITIPPLRDRMDDVLPLARHFLTKFCDKNGRELGELSASVERKLMSYAWPGNVREVENCMERAVVMARGDVIEPDDLVLGGQRKSGVIGDLLSEILASDLTLDDLERQIILEALDRHDGNISQTARTLGLTRRTLQYRLEKIRTAEDDVAATDKEGTR